MRVKYGDVLPGLTGGDVAAGTGDLHKRLATLARSSDTSERCSWVERSAGARVGAVWLRVRVKCGDVSRGKEGGEARCRAASGTEHGRFATLARLGGKLAAIDEVRPVVLVCVKRVRVRGKCGDT